MLITNRQSTNRQGTNRLGKKRPVFIRQPVRCTLALIADGWLRLEQRWEDNPGFVAAAAAGSLGLLLTAAMLINAGLGWLQETPNSDELAAESLDPGERELAEPDLAESHLGEASTDEILVIRSRNFVAKGRNQKTDADRFNDDDSGGQSDPFSEGRVPVRPIKSRIDDNAAADDSTDTALPARIAKITNAPLRRDSFDDDEATEEITDRSTPGHEKVSDKVTGTLTVQTSDAFDDDNELVNEEPAAQRPIAEMRVAAQPQALQPLEMDDGEESSTTDTDQSAETESNTLPPEPARLKPATPSNIANAESKRAKPVENDDRLDQDRSIDLVRGSSDRPVPPDRPVPREDLRWKQQRTKSVAESASPAVAARQSRLAETKIFAAPQARSVPVVKENRTAPKRSSAPPLRLAISGPPSVEVGQPCQIEIRVTNTGSVAAQHLVVSAELPQGLVHDVAQSLEQPVETLAPGATYRALLRLRGESAGEQTIRAEVGVGDQSTLKLSAKVRVTPASETATTIGVSDCFCAPLAR